MHHDSSVQVDAPENASLSEITAAVKKRIRWIATHVEQAESAKRNVLKRDYVSGETHFFLGKQYVLKVFVRKRKLESVKLLRGKLEIVTRSPEPDYVKSLLDAWYLEKANKLLSKRLEAITDEIHWVKNQPPLKMRAMKKQWGSCSPKGVISLNPMLIKAPRECVDYVIAHELCHLKEHNHSKKYYRLLERTFPEWKATKARLDGMSELLLNQ